MAALAYAAHTLLATTPWLEFTQPERFDPTVRDGFESVNLGPWADTDPWDWNDDDEAADHDDGDLTSTID